MLGGRTGVAPLVATRHRTVGPSKVSAGAGWLAAESGVFAARTPGSRAFVRMSEASPREGAGLRTPARPDAIAPPPSGTGSPPRVSAQPGEPTDPPHAGPRIRLCRVRSLASKILRESGRASRVILPTAVPKTKRRALWSTPTREKISFRDRAGSTRRSLEHLTSGRPGSPEAARARKEWHSPSGSLRSQRRPRSEESPPRSSTAMDTSGSCRTTFPPRAPTGTPSTCTAIPSIAAPT